jgi:predicted LPLAT superfamily acyltransferase
LQPEEIARLFVIELEQKVKAYPEQWFNYYNFFEEEKKSTAETSSH